MHFRLGIRDVKLPVTITTHMQVSIPRKGLLNMPILFDPWASNLSRLEYAFDTGGYDIVVKKLTI